MHKFLLAYYIEVCNNVSFVIKNIQMNVTFVLVIPIIFILLKLKGELEVNNQNFCIRI